MDFSQIQLIYRAEGNANLVLVLPQHKKVLRLPKMNPDNSKNESITLLDPELHIAYMKLITQFLGDEYSFIPEIVIISTLERNKINRFAAPYRPVERLDKEFCGQFGFLLPDATHLPSFMVSNLKTASRDTFSIEIKPKQGWMLQNSTQCRNLFDLKCLNKCRYCCMQYLKLKTNKIKNISNYCPMDLFSGNPERMRKAIDGLLNEPQNNLRIFKNGILVYGSRSTLYKIDDLIEEISIGNTNVFYDLLISCLLKNFEIIRPTINGYNKNTKIEIRSNNLPQGCVLEKVLQLQLLAKENLEFMTKENYNLTKTYNYLPDLIKKRSNNLSITDLTPTERYIIGATCMDCSIMLTFKKIEESDIENFNNNTNTFQIGSENFIGKVTILDLDPKSDNHFSKYLKQTNDAYSAALEFLAKSEEEKEEENV